MLRRIKKDVENELSDKVGKKTSWVYLGLIGTNLEFQSEERFFDNCLVEE